MGGQSDHKPAKRLEIAERWSGHATLAILGGILLEIILLFVFPGGKSWSEIWLLVVANAAIGIGLAIEYACIRRTIVASGDLQRESDAKLSEAIDRAVKAEAELIEFRKPRRSKIRPNIAALSGKMKILGRTKFDVGIGAGSGEQADCAWDIEEMLTNAGWSQMNWGVHEVGVSVVERGHGGHRPVAGSVGAQNIEIHLAPDFRQSLLPAANGLASALTEIGVAASEVPFNANSTNNEAIHILIGPKQ
jgi:hypothetical protein